MSVGFLYQILQNYLTIYYNCVIINTIVQPDTFRSQVSRGTDSFILMTSFLLIAALTCSGSQYLIEDVQKDKYLPQEEKADVIEIIKLNSEEGCWDAND